MESKNNMSWRTILEAMDDISSNIKSLDDDPMNQSVGDDEGSAFTPAVDDDSDKDLLDELTQIFTPILVMQGFENDLSDQIQEAFSQENLLTEQNMIQFDDATRMAQLISVCALLIQRKKNTEKWQTYQKAATIRNQMKLDMQKEEYNAAKQLAQKFLVKVSTTNSSAIARQTATKLLPQTQH